MDCFEGSEGLVRLEYSLRTRALDSPARYLQAGLGGVAIDGRCGKQFVSVVRGAAFALSNIFSCRGSRVAKTPLLLDLQRFSASASVSINVCPSYVRRSSIRSSDLRRSVGGARRVDSLRSAWSMDAPKTKTQDHGLSGT